MRLGLAIFCILLTLIGAGARAASGAAPESASQTFRTEVVDTSDRSSWPDGDWFAINAERWEQFAAAGGANEDRGNIEDREKEVYIESARYRARLDGDALADGTLEASIRNVSGYEAFLDLGRTSLAISAATMDGMPAIWGADPQGRVRLQVAGETSTLSAGWSLRGRRVLDRLVFDVALVSAMSSRLELTLPADRTLESDVGIVEFSPVDAATQTRRWRVELGRRDRCRLLIGNGSTEAEGPAAIFADVSAVYSVRPDGLHIQTDFIYSTTDDVPFDTSFRVPWRFELRSVAYVDSRGETALPYRRNLGRSLVAVSIAGSPAGRRATLRVRGVLPLRWDTHRRIALPRIELQDIVEMSRRLTLKIERPMELSAIETQGYRQVAFAADDRSETWNLEELQANSPISVSVGLPNSVLSGRSVCRVDLTEGVPTMLAAVRFEATSGSTFTARCAIPDGWNVTRVEPLRGAMTSALASWEVSDDPTSGMRVLRLEFQQGLTPQSVRELLVSARFAESPVAGRDVAMPALVPLNAIDTDVYVVMRSAADQVPQLPAESGYVAIERSELPGNVQKTIQEIVGTADAADWIVLRARNPEVGETLLMRSAEAALDETNLPSSDAGGDDALVSALPAVERVPGVSLRIDSWLAPGGERQHRHAVHYQFATKSRSVPRMISIPPGVRIETLEINDRDVVPFVLDGTLQLPARPRALQSVRIVFRTSGQFGFLQQTDRLLLPQWNLDIVEYEWQIFLPPGRRFAGLDESRWIVAQPPPLTWLQRLLGPLARSPQSSTFDQSAGQQAALEGPTSGDLPSAVGGEVVVAAGREFGTSAVIRTWNPPRVASLSVVVLLATLTFLTLLRQRSCRFPPSAVILWWSLLFGGALLAPDCFAPLFGAACSGTILAMMLPRTLVVRFDLLSMLRGPSPEASSGTKSSVVVTSIIVGALVWAGWSRGWAQEPSPEPVAADLSGVAPVDVSPVDVLIPQPPAETRQVYVRESLLQRIEDWEQEQVPRYLIRSAEYTVQPSDRDTIDLTVRYDVLLRDHSGPVRIVLPLQGVTFASSDSCRVNGEPARVIPSLDGRGGVVEVDAAVLEAVAAGTSEMSAALSPVSIELRCRGRVLQTRSGRRFRAVIPSITSTRVLVEKIPEDGSRHTVSGSGLIREQGHSLDVEFGPAEDLVVTWETSAPLESEPSGLSASILSMVEVGTQRLRLRHNMTLSSVETDEPLTTVTLNLPPRMFVESIRGETLLATYSARNAEGGTDVRLEFSEPISDATQVGLDLVMPTDSRSTLVTIPVPQLLEQATIQRRIVGVIAPPGLRVAASSDAAATATSTVIPAGKAGDLWAEAVEWPVPEVAFDVRNPGTVIVKLTPLQTERAASMQQMIVVQRDQLRWSAQIQLEVSLLPTFLHRVDLDPRIRLDGVSVEQDGAERLRRSVREARRLTLFLNSDRLGTQTIRLSGTLSSGMPYEAVNLPELGVQDARIVESDVTIINESGWNVEVTDAEGTIVAGAGFNAGTADSPDSRQVFGPIRNQGERSLLLKIDPGDDAARTDQLVDVSRRGNHWQYTAVTRVTAQAGPLRRVRVWLPAELNVASEIEPGENVIGVEPSEGGGTTLIFAPDPRSPEEFAFLIRSRIVPPRTGDWSPPVPEVLSSHVGDRYLTLAADSAFSPIASDVNEIAIDDVPEWARQAAVGPVRPDSEARAFQLTAERVILRRHVAASGSSVDVVLAEGFIWLDEHGAVSASMDWRFGWSRTDTIDVEIPDGVRLRAASLNGRGISTETIGDDRLRVVLPQSSGIGELTLLWDADARPDGWNSYQQPLPRILNTDVDTVLLAFLDRRHGSGLHAEQARTLTQAAWLLDRYDAMLQFAERQVGRAYDVDGPLLSELRLLEASLRRLQSADATSTWSDEQRTRFDELLQRRAELGEQIEVSATLPAQSAATVEDEADWQLTVSTVIPGTEETVSRIQFAVIPVVTGQPPVLRWTSFPEWLHLHTIGTIVLLLVLVTAATLLARWNRRREFANWIADRPLLGLVILGLTWWLVMQPAVVGLLIVALAAGLKVAALLRTLWRPLSAA